MSHAPSGQSPTPSRAPAPIPGCEADLAPASAFGRRLAKASLRILRVVNRRRFLALKGALKAWEARELWRRYQAQSYRLSLPLPAGGGSFKHSGNAGDVIYALPTIRALAGAGRADMRLALGVPRPVDPGRSATYRHPLGRVMLDQGMLGMLAPLLLAQPYVASVRAHDGGAVDFDLDAFRESPLPTDRIGINRWYLYYAGVGADFSAPWLTAEPDARYAGRVVVARSSRYRGQLLDYGFLRRLDRPVFLGVEEEYAEMSAAVPNLEWARVDDLLQMARLIAGCRLFVGNQSMPFALAEGLKVTRVLESTPECPVSVPIGPRGYDAYFQPHFEHLVTTLAGG